MKKLAIAALCLLIPVAARAQYVISTFAGGVGPPTPVAGLGASVGQAFSVAADPFGNIYFGSDLACVFKQDPNGILTRIAGTCRAGFSGDGGPAAQAQLAARPGVAVDSAGNLYIADRSNQRVRKVLPDGSITTIAGSGKIVPNGGDGGPAAQAQLAGPAAIAFDSAGNMYIGGGDGLRKVLPDGVITTIAKGDIGFPYGVGGVAVDSTGNIFVTEPERNQVRKITAAGVVSTPISFDYPQALALDPAGNLYIAEHDNNSITVLAPDGSRMLVAGSCGLTGPGPNVCVGGFAGDGGPATKATLGFPYGVAVSLGNLYIADTANRRIRKVSANGVINTISGNGGESYSGDGGPAGKAQLGGPSGAAIDSAGNLYFADSNNDRIRKISPTGTITTVAGSGTPGFSGDGGLAVNAQLKLSTAPDGKVGVTIDPAGNLYVADAGNGRIRKVSRDGIITTAAVAGGADVAVDGGGNIFVADSGNIRKISPAGVIATVAQGAGPIALDSAGNLYFSDQAYPNYGIHKLSASGGGTLVSTLVVQTPMGPYVALALDSAGSVYFASSFRVMKFPSGPSAVIAGNGSTGYTGDGGPALSAPLNVSGLAVDVSGNVYVMDSVDNAIRLLRPGQLPASPSIDAVTNGASSQAGPVAPGEIVVLYGSNLGPAQLAQFALNAAGLVGTSLAGTQVFFNGIPAPILYTSAGQVAAVAPYVPPLPLAYQVTVSYQGQVSPPVAVPFASSSPALITANSTGSGQAAAVNSDGSLNSAGAPIGIGGVIVLYATGEGFTNPPGIDGKPAAAPLPVPFLVVTATIGGQPAVVQYAGGAPGFVAGLMQVNLLIPANISPGAAVPVVLKVGVSQSQGGVTIAVAGN